MNYKRFLMSLFLLTFCAVVFSFAAFAQDSTNAPPPDAIAGTVAAAAQPFILTFAATHPVVSTILVVIGFLRSFLKPVMTLVEAALKQFSPTSDASLLKFEAGPGFKWVLWLLDWLGSIKLPSAANASANPLIKT